MVLNPMDLCGRAGLGNQIRTQKATFNSEKGGRADACMCMCVCVYVEGVCLGKTKNSLLVHVIMNLLTFLLKCSPEGSPVERKEEQ